MADSQSNHPLSDLHQIPGLGLIRVRALIKAGYTDIASLRSASQKQLEKVRGITPIKAKQILDFLKTFDHSGQIKSEQEEAHSAMEQTADAAPAAHEDLTEGANRLIGVAAMLLSVPYAARFRPRLINQIRKLIWFAGNLSRESLNPGVQGNLLAIQMEQARLEMVSLSTQKPNRKEQVAAAAEIRRYRKQMEALLQPEESTEP